MLIAVLMFILGIVLTLLKNIESKGTVQYCVPFRITVTAYLVFWNAVVANRPSNQSIQQAAAISSYSWASEGLLTIDDNNWVEKSIMEWIISRLDVAGRTLMALSFILFCMRLLHFYAISGHLGPKLVMIQKMVCVYCQIFYAYIQSVLCTMLLTSFL